MHVFFVFPSHGCFFLFGFVWCCDLFLTVSQVIYFSSCKEVHFKTRKNIRSCVWVIPSPGICYITTNIMTTRLLKFALDRIWFSSTIKHQKAKQIAVLHALDCLRQWMLTIGLLYPSIYQPTYQPSQYLKSMAKLFYSIFFLNLSVFK